MTSVPIEVPDWLGAKSFTPRMTASVGLPVSDALSLVADALVARGYKVKDRTGSGFRASWVDKWVLLGIAAATDIDVKRTRLAVSAVPSDGGSTLTIAVEKGGEHRAGRRRGREALTEAFQDAQRRGVPVSTTSWASGTMGT
ncbi:hypothetical protein [Nocardioides sp.]|uniref:hypothetical protein n=1 Tax=Nocardioides sp. TaxID=35761 RepID=UPI002E3653EF|nr:hypothetical protein [Nocardioides sp.]